MRSLLGAGRVDGAGGFRVVGAGAKRLRGAGEGGVDGARASLGASDGGEGNATHGA